MVELRIKDYGSLDAIVTALQKNGYPCESFIHWEGNQIDHFSVRFAPQRVSKIIPAENNMEVLDMGITCCKDCVKPKRYPGCHDRCPEYLEEKKKYEEEREAERKRNRYTVYEQRQDGVDKAYKRKGGKKRV